MAKFTVQDILNARPNLSFDGTLSGDTELVRDNEGYAVKMTGYYEFNELLAIAREVQNLNVVFAEKPETDSYAVFKIDLNGNAETVDVKATYAEAVQLANTLDENEDGENFHVKPIPTK